MGDGMARNLLEGGRDLIVWNRTGSKAADFSQQTGCETAKTPKEVREKWQGSERRTKCMSVRACDLFCAF